MFPTYVWVILVVFLVLAPVIAVARRVKGAKEKSGDNIGRDLRQTMLTTRPAQLGIKSTPEFPRIYGVLMDWPLDNHIMSVFSTSQGTASLYTTSTFGIIGGEGHEAVRNASLKFVSTADRHFDSSTPATEFPYPAPGRVRFYFLSFGGVRVIDTDLAGTAEQRTGSYTELFDLGQDVVTQLRLATEERR